MDRFRIDRNNLPTISARPRKPDDREKLIRVRKGPKNHSVNREKSFDDRKRAAKLKAIIAKPREEHLRFRDACRAYWRGERDGHP